MAKGRPTLIGRSSSSEILIGGEMTYVRSTDWWRHEICFLGRALAQMGLRGGVELLKESRQRGIDVQNIHAHCTLTDTIVIVIGINRL